MQAAFNPDVPLVDQSIGAHASHSNPGSRFNEFNSRVGQSPVGADVTEAVAGFKAGTFTEEDLNQLAFAMGYQIVKGKDTAALVAKIAELQNNCTAMAMRASNAEKAFVGRENLTDENIKGLAESVGLETAPIGTAATTQASIAELTTRAEAAELALASAKNTTEPANGAPQI